MGFMKLNRYSDPSGGVFDASAVVEKACLAFPGARVLPGDPLALSAERAAASGAADHVVRTLRRNQQVYGPALAFEISDDSGGTIQGRARRFDVTFLFADSLGKEWRVRLLHFLQSLGTGRIEESTETTGKNI